MSGIKKRAACLAACFLALIFVFAQPLCAQAASVSAPLPEVRTLTYSEKETCKKDLFLSARFADEAGTLLPYRYYLPEGEDLPLIVFLHGGGERGTDNDRQLDNAFHGKEDPIIPYENATPALCEAIEACGKGKLNFVAFEDGAHDIWEQAIVFAGAEGLPALDDWLFSQRRAHTQNKLVYVIAGAAAAVLAAGIALSVFAVRSKRAKCASGG